MLFAQGFQPKQLGSCVLWLRGDLGLTTLDAVVAGSNDLTVWNVISCTATVDEITDSNDSGTPTAHYLSQVPVSGLQFNHSATFSIEAKAGTLSHIAIQLGDSGPYAFADLGNGTLGSVSNGVGSVVDAGGGWYRLTLDAVVANAGNAYIVLAAVDNLYGYAGTGTGKLKVRNISITQRNASIWADQSGAGNNLTSGVASNYALLEAAGLNGRPSILGDASNDYLKSAGFTLNQPCTVLATVQTQSLIPNATFWDGNTNNTMLLYDDGGHFTMYAGNAGPQATRDTNPRVFCCVYNGASSVFNDGNVETTGDVGASNAGGFTILTRGSIAATFGNYRFGDIIVYSRALTAAERRFAVRALGLRTGIAVA